MTPLITHTGIAVPLRRDNVDTDQLYPAQRILTAPQSRTGHAEALMGDWREDPAFVLNNPSYDGASVLVAGRDFGTGSSREWAVWALADYGFRVVLAPRFGDIFRGNTAENGLVAGEMSEADIEELWVRLEDAPGTRVEVNLEQRTVRCGTSRYDFGYPEHFRQRVMRGLDEIALTLEHAAEIEDFEARRRATMPRVTDGASR
ncbi:3-isopropylmalate dehydratase small subunit [Streptomyces sp. BH106]|uniref:3-isopropylmalate dehydratase small subunit n=1 Tax=Streptomyces sp. BH106 TaxID=3410409 RepID=UPI003CE8BB44